MPDDQISIIHREDIEGLIPPCPFGRAHPRVLVPTCHPDSMVNAVYLRGVLALYCGSCNRPIWGVRVQNRPEIV